MIAPNNLANRCELTKTQLDPRSSIRACLCTDDYCNRGEGEVEMMMTMAMFSAESTMISVSSGVACPDILVTGADYADCNGVYSVTDSSVLYCPTL